MAKKNSVDVNSMMVYDGSTFDPNATMKRLNEVIAKFKEELAVVQGDTPAFGVDSDVKKEFVESTNHVKSVFMANREGRAVTAPVERLQPIYEQVLSHYRKQGIDVNSNLKNIAKNVARHYNNMYALAEDGETYIPGKDIESGYVIKKIKDRKIFDPSDKQEVPADNATV